MNIVRPSLSLPRAGFLVGVMLVISLLGAMFAVSPAVAAVGHDYVSQLPEVPLGAPVSGSLGAPVALTVDEHANVWVYDASKHAVDEFDASGAFVCQETEEGKLASQGEQYVTSVAVAPGTGRLYVADSFEDAVDVFEPGCGKLVEKWTGPSTPQASFGKPHGRGSKVLVAVEQTTGDVYVASEEFGVVDRLNAAGEYQSPQIATDGASIAAAGGHLYVVSEGNVAGEGAVAEYDSATGASIATLDAGETPLGSIFTLPNPTRQFEPPYLSIDPRSHVAVDSAGDVFVADTGHKVVAEFGPSGKYVGQVNGAQTPAGLMVPNGVAVTSGGALYVSSFNLETGSEGVVNKFGAAATQNTLAVSVVGGGSATIGEGRDSTVTSAPGGIAEGQSCPFCVVTKEMYAIDHALGCEFKCSAQFDPGTTVALSEAPATGFRFVGWSGGGCSGASACDVTLGADAEVTATFEPLPKHVLTVVKAGTGSGTVVSEPAGIECGATCSAEFPEGKKVLLTASEETGSVFARWEGCPTEPAPGKCELTLTADTSVTAVFEPVPTHSLTVVESGTGAGTVTSTPPGISCPGTCTADFNTGTHVTLTAVANGTSTFAGWSGGGCSGTGTCEVTLSAATQVTAEFTGIAQDTLTVVRAGSGVGRVTSVAPGIDCGPVCSHTYNDGAHVALEPLPGADASFVGWAGAGCSGTGTCELTLSESAQVTAQFSAVAREACPNEQLRAEQPFAGQLPDCRAYEMVSPLAKNGGEAADPGEADEEYWRAAASGAAVTYNSIVSFAEPQTQPQASLYWNQYLSRRGASGWATGNITTPYVPINTNPTGPWQYVTFTPELTSGVTETDWPLAAEASEGFASLYDASLGASALETSYRLLTNAAEVELAGEPFTYREPPAVVGASTDLSHIVFDNYQHQYEWVDGRAYDIGRGPTPGARLQLEGVAGGDRTGHYWRRVSADGLKVSMSTATQPEQVYVRVNPELPESSTGGCGEAGRACTVQASASQKTNGTGPGGSDPLGAKQPAVYVGASTDGERQFFLSNAELTDDAYTGPADNLANLYEYNLETGRLADLTVDTTDANGAAVQGIVKISADGTYVYLVATGALAPGAVAGQPNLYLSRPGEPIRLVATLDPASPDIADWGMDVPRNSARITEDGTRLAFVSTLSLTGYNNRQAEPGQCEESVSTGFSHADEDGRCREVFEYDATKSTLTCASCNPSGARPVGPSELGHIGFDTEGEAYTPRNFSQDGSRLFFQSRDALSPHDSNGLEDVYEYEDGQVYPVSDVAAGQGSVFMDASTNGDDVFIATQARLVAQDTDTRTDVYDVRVDGGFPGHASPPACENADSCKPPASPEPSIFGAPASATFSGPGNPPSPPASPPSKKKSAAQIRAEKLGKALKACKKLRSKARRQACVRAAEKRYGPVKGHKARKTARMGAR